MPVKRPLLAAGAIVVCFAVTVACSSANSSSSADTASVPPSPPSSNGFVPPGSEAPCPGNTPPAVGSGCTAPSQFSETWNGRCEYGHDVERDCNDVFECTGRWKKLTPSSSCYGRCPASFDKIIAGSRCDDRTMGCSYLEGTCACVSDANEDAGAADGGADGGSSQLPNVGRWYCAPRPKSGCPAQRPPLGSDCVRPMTCDYGSCTLLRAITYACEGGRWVQADSRCPQ